MAERLLYVTVPYRDEPELTCSMIRQLALQSDINSILLMDNGSQYETDVMVSSQISHLHLWDRATILYRPDVSLTAMWNEAWQRSLVGADEVDLAILNNDLVIPEGFLARMAQELRSDNRLWMVAPDHRIGRPFNEPGQVRFVQGTQRVGGLHGAAFMVKAEARRAGLPPIDEQFHIWCGDDDLVYAIRAAGYEVGLIEGLGYEHVGGGSQTFKNHPELVNLGHEDLERCFKKWGR